MTLALKVRQEPQDQLVQPELREQQDHKGLSDFKAHKAKKEIRETLVLKGFRVFKDYKALKEFKVTRV